jgi:hypothetical protein
MPAYQGVPSYTDEEIDRALERLTERHAYDAGLLQDIRAISDRVWAAEVNYIEGQEFDSCIAAELMEISGITAVRHRGPESAPCYSCTISAAVSALQEPSAK